MRTLDETRRIFCEAIEKQTQQEREAYLDEACCDNPSLRAEIDALLEAHYGQDDLLSGPILGSPATAADSALSESPGTVIDKYKLLERIGEGGMAVVYMAEQEKLIRRKVALKIIKLGMDTKSVIARFEAERQALAMMDHPNIAKVLDAGATETGRPYFVMELVTGVSITEYCDKNKLSTARRLDLFVQVCSAVHHAHQKGIIHRDVKPTNVMVTLHDGKPVPRVIDFGIAKAVNQRLTEKTFFTRYGHMLGTPAYMSPEQAEMSGLDVDTRADVYSLGVLLYELLTGTTPFEAEKLRAAGYVEMQRILHEQEPTRPSTKLSTMGQMLAQIAESRNTKPDLLSRLIRGDLDWIVMKSLEKDRTRRYDSASALAVDVRRHLHNEPILARAPKTTYRLQKFLRRHRSQTIAAASIVVLVGALITVLLLFRSKLAEVESLKHERILSQAREYFYSNKDLTAALTTLEPILDSENVGPEARLLCANIYLYRAEHYHYLGDEDNVVADMERYVNILDRLEATDQGNRQLKDMLIGLWRGTPENLGPSVNSASYDSDICISNDGLWLYFTSNRPGGSGSYDIWVTTRETAQHPWREPVNLGPTVNSSTMDGVPFISADGSTLLFMSNRSGGFGSEDIWFTTRTTLSDPWGTPVNLGSAINSSAADASPIISLDGLSLFFCSTRSGGYGGQDLMVSTRPTLSDPWAEPVNLGPTVNSSAWDYTPALSADCLSLIFGSYRPDGLGRDDLWLTTRQTIDDPWGGPVNLGPTINSSVGEGGASLSADGSTLYFGSRRPGGSGDCDIWQVSIEPIVDFKGDAETLQKSLESDDGKEGRKSMKYEF